MMSRIGANMEVAPRLFDLQLQHLYSTEAYWLMPGASITDIISGYTSRHPPNEWKWVNTLRSCVSIYIYIPYSGKVWQMFWIRQTKIIQTFTQIIIFKVHFIFTCIITCGTLCLAIKQLGKNGPTLLAYCILVLWNWNLHSISNLPWGKSSEYRLWPFTTQLMLPPCLRKTAQGRYPSRNIVLSPLIILAATNNESLGFPTSHS